MSEIAQEWNHKIGALQRYIPQVYCMDCHKWFDGPEFEWDHQAEEWEGQCIQCGSFECEVQYVEEARR